MADLWVPFVAAFIAAAAVLLVRQAVLTWTRRPSVRHQRPVAARAIIPVKNPAVEPLRVPRVEITPGRPISQARPVGPIIIGGPTIVPQPAPSPVIVTAVVSPARIAAPAPVREAIAAVTTYEAPRTLDAEPAPIAISTRTAPRRETPVDVESDQSRRLRIAVGPGRPTTTVGAEAKVWSQWTQEVRTSESTQSTPAESAVPAASDRPAASDLAGDEECPHCSSARYRGARFCGRCGRNLASAVTAS